VRKFVRLALFVGLMVAAAAFSALAAMRLWIWYETKQVENFYREHHLLSEMRTRQHDSTNNSATAREALLERVPLGSPRGEALAALRMEGFWCSTSLEPVSDANLRQRFLEARDLASTGTDDAAKKPGVECQTVSSAVFGQVQWIMALQFDADDRLTEARVAKWNSVL